MLRRTISLMSMGLAAGLLAAGAAWAADTPPATNAPAKAAPAKAAAAAPAKGAPAKSTADEVAVMETSKGTMVIEFWQKDAPQTVANFKKLARQGFFDGTGFHRIIKGFMIQGGDPLSKNPSDPNLGTGGPGYTIPDEFNAHKHVAGVLSMANTGQPHSAGSSFFIMDGASPMLDGHFTAFGHLIRGMDVLEKIANTPCTENPMMSQMGRVEKSKPLEWTKIIAVKIVPRPEAMGAAKAAAAKGAEKAAAAKGAAEKGGEKAAGAGVDMKKAVEGAKSATPATPAQPAGKDTTGGK